MCPNCGGNSDPAGTVSGIVDGLASRGVKYGMMYVFYLFVFSLIFYSTDIYFFSWFDIEQCTGCWDSAASNADYMARV